MTLTELRYLVAVARERHFGRAAEQCAVTQPALSLAIQKLEDELGVAVFERRKADVTVTPIGERVVEQAQHVLEAAEQLKVIAAAGQDPLAGVFRLGVIATVGPYLLPHVIPILRSRAPAMPIEIEENLTANLSGMLKRGKLDAIVIALPFHEPDIVTRPLYAEPFKVVVPATHRWAKKSRVDATALAEEPVILPHAGHCFRRNVLDQCPEISRADTEGLQGNSLETIRQMVASGLGITVMPCSALTAKHHIKHLVTLEFTEPAPRRQIGLAWRKRFTRPVALDVITDAIQAVKIPGLQFSANGGKR